MKKIRFSKESELLIDFAQELISEYNESLTKELKNFRYKINCNDSYERLVYKVNGKMIKKYTDRLKNSLKIDLNRKILEMGQQLNDKQIDGIVLNEIISIIEYINIQPVIIHDVLLYLNNQEKRYRNKYDLNIYENDNLIFTQDCLEIDYIKLSKPILNYINNSENKRASIVKSVTLLEKLCNKINAEEYHSTKSKIRTKYAQ